MAPIDRDEISFVAHAEHPVAAPVADASVVALLRRVKLPRSQSVVVDLGCGRGEWLLRLLEDRPTAHGVGVDRSQRVIARAKARASDLGLAERSEWICGDAAGELEDRARVDAALCVGASHALGGLTPCLVAIGAKLAPGGQLLYGDGFWAKPSTPEALDGLGASADDLPDLAGLEARARRCGFEVEHVFVSDENAWDAYEAAWCGSVEATPRRRPMRAAPARSRRPPARIALGTSRATGASSASPCSCSSAASRPRPVALDVAVTQKESRQPSMRTRRPLPSATQSSLS